MAKKSVKKTTKKTSKTSRKTVKRSARKSPSKASRKTSSRTSKKTSSKTPNTSSKTRSQRCILVCGKDRCVDACTTDSGAVSGECIPCPICGHGHFCENDYECLSCGATRELVVRPYKGA